MRKIAHIVHCFSLSENISEYIVNYGGSTVICMRSHAGFIRLLTLLFTASIILDMPAAKKSAFSYISEKLHGI